MCLIRETSCAILKIWMENGRYDWSATALRSLGLISISFGSEVSRVSSEKPIGRPCMALSRLHYVSKGIGGGEQSHYLSKEYMQ